ncbi:MAG TPA: hypothetical protein VNG73_02040 [Gemmatimonadaceae bacterium]|jgi:hypothetical protein|nr:hypothetical protein [Gemmatimonadaceae bacterium]
MHISFAVFADAANLSQEGKLNVLGVFDAVQVAGLPTIHPRTHFVVRLKATADDVGQHSLAFRWLSPRDEELWSSTGEMSVAQPPNPMFEVDLPIIAVVDLPLNMVGQYTMQVALDGSPSAAARLFVNAPVQSPMVGGAPNGMVS